MSPVPATTANALIRHIREVGGTGQWTGDVSGRLMLEAQRLRAVDISEGDMVIGMIHCMDGNIPAMRRAFRNSMAFAPTASPPRMNYALALTRCGFFAESLAIMQDEEKRRVLTDQDYSLLAMICFGLGLLAKARQFHELSDLRDFAFSEKIWASVLPASPRQLEALAVVTQSLTDDAAVWQSLSNR